MSRVGGRKSIPHISTQVGAEKDIDQVILDWLGPLQGQSIAASNPKSSKDNIRVFVSQLCWDKPLQGNPIGHWLPLFQLSV